MSTLTEPHVPPSPAFDRVSYARTLGAALRAVRRSRQLSLNGVEKTSNGRLKAVVISSYERADRAVTAVRLAEIAAFYRIPVRDLLPAEPTVGTAVPANQ